MGALIAVMGGVAAVVAVAVVLVFVVGVFRGSSRPRVTDDIQELVLGKSQIPSGLELDRGECPGPPDTRGLKDCYAAFYRDKGGEPRVFSAAFTFTDASSAGDFQHGFKDAFSNSAFCTDENGKAGRMTVSDQPDPGLGDESGALLVSCPDTNDGVLWAWRVDNVVQVVAAEDAVQVKDLAGKIEARK